MHVLRKRWLTLTLLSVLSLGIGCQTETNDDDATIDESTDLYKMATSEPSVPSIQKGSQSLHAYAMVRIASKGNKTTAVLTVKNTLMKRIYVPLSFESKNISFLEGETEIATHMDGGHTRFPVSYKSLAPGGTHTYLFALDSPPKAGTSYVFSIWAPIRDRKNWRRILERDDVVYIVTGAHSEPAKEKPGITR